MGWPIVVGLISTAAFFALMFWGPLNHPLAHRYFAGHPVSMVETGLFFIGLAALGFKVANILGQQAASRHIALEEPPRGGQRIAECGGLLDALEQLPARARDS